VVGVMEKQGSTFFESTDSHVYLPITTFDTHYPWIKKEIGVNIATVPRRPEWVDKITEEGTAVLRARRHVPFNKPNDFGLLTPDKLIGNFKKLTGGITLAMIAAGGASRPWTISDLAVRRESRGSFPRRSARRATRADARLTSGPEVVSGTTDFVVTLH